MITEEDKDKLIATLTLQLQEKEKENQELTSRYITWRNKSDEYKQEFHKSMNEAEDYKKMFYCLCGQQEQAKIEFVVEQLEKVKEIYKKHLDYERIYDEFRVQMLEEDIEDLIADISKMVKTP